jgi:4-diphosphocytidyl-2-C-methyl-D-erythritol kinase
LIRVFQLELIKMIQLNAPAKVNLTLKITGRNDGNYHELQSLVAFTNFGDILNIEETNDKNKITVSGNYADLCQDGTDNLLMKACDLLNSVGFDKKFHIHLIKKIPIGAGLGGGSSDAGCFLKYLHEKYHIDEKIIIQIAEKLGADVPVCFYQKPCWMQGIGENITFLKKFPAIHSTLIYKLGAHFSTRDIFAVYHKINRPFSEKLFPLPLEFNDISDLMIFLNDLQDKNDLLTPAQYHDTGNILKTLLNDAEKVIKYYQLKPLFYTMSGSGSSFIYCFQDQKSATTFKEAMQEGKYFAIQTNLQNM